MDEINLTTPSSSVSNTMFSPSAIEILKAHPVTAQFIYQYEEEQRELEAKQKDIPDGFYDVIHQYLLELHDIGTKSDSTSWSFPENVMDLCQQAKIKVLEKITACCSPEQRITLSRMSIEAQLRMGSNIQALFDDILYGRDHWDCVITQQIMLWSMLRKERPEIEIPGQILTSSQGRLFNLGDTPLVDNRELRNSDSAFQQDVIIIGIDAVAMAFFRSIVQRQRQRQRQRHQMLTGFDSDSSSNDSSPG